MRMRMRTCWCICWDIAACSTPWSPCYHAAEACWASAPGRALAARQIESLKLRGKAATEASKQLFAQCRTLKASKKKVAKLNDEICACSREILVGAPAHRRVARSGVCLCVRMAGARAGAGAGAGAVAGADALASASCVSCMRLLTCWGAQALEDKYAIENKYSTRSQSMDSKMREAVLDDK